MNWAEYCAKRARIRSDGKIRCAKCRRWKERKFYNNSTKRVVQSYCKRCDLARQRIDPNRSTRRRYKTLRKYGLVEQQYIELLAAQKNVCAICQISSPGDSRFGRLSIDHEHKTGKVRGLLCAKCNKAIGLLHDDPEIARRVVAYLSKED